MPFGWVAVCDAKAAESAVAEGEGSLKCLSAESPFATGATEFASTRRMERCLKCLSAESPFATSLTSSNPLKTSSGLKCLSAESLFATHSLGSPTMVGPSKSQMPFGWVAVCDIRDLAKDYDVLAGESQMPFGWVAVCDFTKALKGIGLPRWGLKCLSAESLFATPIYGHVEAFLDNGSLKCLSAESPFATQRVLKAVEAGGQVSQMPFGWVAVCDLTGFFLGSRSCYGVSNAFRLSRRLRQ